MACSKNTEAAPAVLKWSKASDNRVVGYRIYFSEISKDENAPTVCKFDDYTIFHSLTVNNVNVVEKSIVPEDFDLEPGQTYYFIIRSFDANNNESCDSNEREYTAPTDYLDSEMIDNCPDNPEKLEPGACGCDQPDIDSDGDQIYDCDDNCPEDPDKTEPGECGCGVSDIDTDLDTVPDCIDECPENPDKTVAGTEGCASASETQIDQSPDVGDQVIGGVEDSGSDTEAQIDQNPDVANQTIDTTEDFDSVPETATDQCPNDPDKTEPGICGCGIADTDTDLDNTPDCIDGCPNDYYKVSAGTCGCGVSDIDSDGDNVADCLDECPDNPDATYSEAGGDCGDTQTEDINYTTENSNETLLEPPLLISPLDETDIPLTPVLTAAPFTTPDLMNNHTMTRWQVSTKKNFSRNKLVLDFVSLKYLQSLYISSYILQPETTYFWRVKYFTDNAESEWAEAAMFSTSAMTNYLDTDENGLLDFQELNEKYDTNIDLDNDGTPDIEQDDIKSIHTAPGNGQVGIKISKDSPVKIEISSLKMQSISPDESLLREDSDLSTANAPFGLLSFQLALENPGDVAKIVIFFSEPLPEGAQWYKNDINRGWIPYDHTVYNEDGYSVTIEIKDGSYGDFDGLENGSIVDPGGIVLKQTESSADSSTTSYQLNPMRQSGTDESGGGCFISTLQTDDMPSSSAIETLSNRVASWIRQLF